MSVTASSEGLKYSACIIYPVQLQGDQAVEVRAFIYSGSKVNVMNLVFVAKLDLSIWLTGIGA